MEKGLKYSVSTRVDNTNIAVALGSGSLDVFATPAMVALMENAALEAVAKSLPEGSTTVGTLVNVAHTRATGMGDIFPAGIVIGKITGVNTDTFDLSNVLEMKSDVDFDNINYVTIEL